MRVRMPSKQRADPSSVDRKVSAAQSMLTPTNVVIDAAIAGVGPANAIAYAMKDIQCEWKDIMMADAAIAGVGPANAIAYAMKDIQCEWKGIMMADRSKREWIR
jgi:hypothetical protein